MPPLYDLDDYDRCLQELNGQASTYCFVRAEVQPDESVAAWRAIAEISQYDRHHFDHRQLYFGLCLRECEASLAGLNKSELEALQAGLLSENAKVRPHGGVTSLVAIQLRLTIDLIQSSNSLLGRYRYKYTYFKTHPLA